MSQLPHSKGQSVSQTRSSLTQSLGAGRACAYTKVVRNTNAMDFVVFSFESYHLVNAGISEDLKGNRFFSSHHTGGSLLGEVLYSLKGLRTPSQSSPWLQRDQPLLTRNYCKTLGICVLQYSASQHLGVSCLTAVQGFKAGYVPGNIFKPRGELML